MTSPALIEDRLAEAELKLEEDVAHGGVYLYIAERNIEEHEVDFPPRLEEIREMIGKKEIESTPLRAMPGVVFWVWSGHRGDQPNGALRCLTCRPTVMFLYSEHDHLFIQEEVGGLAVVTRQDATGRIRLLTKDEAKKVQEFIRVTGFAA